jgi:uncharacterized membrane protein
MTYGPIQFVLIGFEGDIFESDVLDELHAVRMAGAIRLIDFLVIEKDEAGSVWASEVTDLTAEEETQFGAVVGGLLGFGAGGEEGADAGAAAGALAVAENDFGLSLDGINELAHDIPAGHSAILGLFEHTWARELREATLRAGGRMLAQGMLDPAGLVLMGAEMAAAAEAAAAIEAAELIKAEAELEALEAVAAAEVIKAAAAQEAAEALVAAQLLEEAALEEAAAVVAEALAVETAAVEAATEAVETATEVVDAAAAAAAEEEQE